MSHSEGVTETRRDEQWGLPLWGHGGVVDIGDSFSDDAELQTGHGLHGATSRRGPDAGNGAKGSSMVPRESADESDEGPGGRDGNERDDGNGSLEPDRRGDE